MVVQGLMVTLGRMVSQVSKEPQGLMVQQGLLGLQDLEAIQDQLDPLALMVI